MAEQPITVDDILQAVKMAIVAPAAEGKNWRLVLNGAGLVEVKMVLEVHAPVMPALGGRRAKS